MGISSGIRDLERVSRVVNVLFRNGLGYFIQKYGLKAHLPFSKKIAFHKYAEPDSPESRLRKSFEELGGAYVKLGQMLSLRPDLVPESLCAEFAKLQDKVPPFSPAKAKEIIEKELGKPLKKVFSTFSDKPIGAASVSQVHYAVLKNGKKVVVKVQRPGAEDAFKADIDIIYHVAARLEKSKAFGKYSPMAIAKEFERYTKNELNFLVEAGNIEQFYENLKDAEYVRIPKLYRDYTSKRVLTMEYIHGRKLSDLIRDKKEFPKEKVLSSIINTCLKQVFEQSVFHADLHPGNILVLEKGSIALLDFGIVGSLTPYLRKEGVKLYVALVNRDIDGVVNQLLLIGRPEPGADLEKFKSDVNDIVSGWYGSEMRQVRVTHMLHRLFDSCIKNSIKMPPDMVLLAKALLTAEGTGMMLNPRFNFVKESQAYVQGYLKKKAISKESFANFMRKSQDIAEVLEMIPSETLSVLQRIKQGVVKIDIEDTDLKRLASDIDRSSNRLSYAMIMAALIIGGALLMHSGTGPDFWGMSFPSLIIYTIAGFMGIMLLASIVKEGSIWR